MNYNGEIGHPDKNNFNENNSNLSKTQDENNLTSRNINLKHIHKTY